MDSLITLAFESLIKTDEFVSAFFLALFVLTAIYVHVKKVKTEEEKQHVANQDRQIKTLLEQVGFLSEELQKARSELHEIHEQNMRLLQEIAAANIKIKELESLIEKLSN